MSLESTVRAHRAFTLLLLDHLVCQSHGKDDEVRIDEEIAAGLRDLHTLCDGPVRAAVDAVTETHTAFRAAVRGGGKGARP